MITISDPWNFIEKYLPNYHQNNDVAYIDLLSRYIDPAERADMYEEDIKMIEEDGWESIEKMEEYISETEKRLFLEACENLYDNFETFSNE